MSSRPTGASGYQFAISRLRTHLKHFEKYARVLCEVDTFHGDEVLKLIDCNREWLDRIDENVKELIREIGLLSDQTNLYGMEIMVLREDNEKLKRELEGLKQSLNPPPRHIKIRR